MAVAPNIVRVHFLPTGKARDRTQMMDPSFEPVGTDSVIIRNNGSTQTLTSPEMRVIAGGTLLSVEVRDPAGKALLKLRGATLTHDENENIRGIKGLELRVHQASVSVASEGAPLNRFASETAFRSSGPAGLVFRRRQIRPRHGSGPAGRGQSPCIEAVRALTTGAVG